MSSGLFFRHSASNPSLTPPLTQAGAVQVWDIKAHLGGVQGISYGPEAPALRFLTEICKYGLDSYAVLLNEVLLCSSGYRPKVHL